MLILSYVIKFRVDEFLKSNCRHEVKTLNFDLSITCNSQSENTIADGLNFSEF